MAMPTVIKMEAVIMMVWPGYRKYGKSSWNGGSFVL
jgi:hypothetical protein